MMTLGGESDGFCVFRLLFQARHETGWGGIVTKVENMTLCIYRDDLVANAEASASSWGSFSDLVKEVKLITY